LVWGWDTDIRIEEEGISARLYHENKKNTFPSEDAIRVKATLENSSRKRINNAKIILSGIWTVFLLQTIQKQVQ
jgi:hypothetical protein